MLSGMTHRYLPVWITLGMLSMAATVSAQSPLRVACVGDSITFGAELPDRARQSYPAVLERLSEGRLITGNFGVSGTTALQSPFRAWTRTQASREALAFAPDIVVIMLGINDLAFPDLHSRYPADLRDIVQRFQGLRSRPRLFLCTLTPIAPEDSEAHANRLIRDTFNPAIRSVAEETGAALIDISAAFPNRLELLPDGLHPSPEGAEIIARTVLAALPPPPPSAPEIRAAPVAGPVDISIRHEVEAARYRATRWLETRPAPADLREPASFWSGSPPSTPDEASALLPLLDGRIPDDLDDPYFAFAALATALRRIGHETVFLDDNRPVIWREALLHQLVQRLRIDAGGGGFWGDPGGDPDGNLRSTVYALQAIEAALGPAGAP